MEESANSSQPQPAGANQYEQERRSKLAKLRELGVDPYGGRTEGVQANKDVRALHKPEFGQDGGPISTVAGRVMFRKSFGKLTFMTVRDETGDLQVAVDKKRVPEKDWLAHDLIDLGDTIVATGKLGQTKTGEVTIWATGISFAAKALLPPPAKWEGLSDVEARYRQRYVDLWANPEVMKTLKLRMRIVEEIRQFMRDRGFLEVETPMMQTLHGGAAARPFATHHNALDIQLYMRIAPELFLKRLLVGGFTKVFELNRNFRNEGISPRHNPEFTMLEAYEAFGSWETMAELVESMICTIAEKLLGSLQIVHHEDAKGTKKTINLEGDTSKPKGQRWRRVRMADLVEERTGWKFDKRDIREASVEAFDLLAQHYAQKAGDELARVLKALPEIARDLSGRFSVEELEAWVSAKVEEAKHPAAKSMKELELDYARAIIGRLDAMSPAEQLQEVYEKLIEPTLVDPCFVTHVPAVIIPLAKKAPEPGVKPEDWFFADVYELAINGQEISPGYTELNDPDVQAANFAHQVGDKEEQQKTDEDFLNALRYGMPPAGGMGLGIDRLVMMLTGAESIRDVILFPLMKPQE